MKREEYDDELVDLRRYEYYLIIGCDRYGSAEVTSNVNYDWRFKKVLEKRSKLPPIMDGEEYEYEVFENRMGERTIMIEIGEEDG